MKRKILSMKRILFVTTISGFLPQFESNDVKLLKEMGCEIHYASNFRNPIYTFDQEKLIQEDIKLHQIDIEKSPVSRSNYKAIKQVKNIIDVFKIDIVHCHNPMGGVCARVAAKISNRKPYVIYTAHGFHFYSGAPVQNWLLYYSAEKFLAHWTDQIITINGEDYNRANHFSLKKDGKVAQIHGVGVDTERFNIQGTKKRSDMRRQLDIPEDGFVLVTAAELNSNKNQRIVIEALRRLKSDEGVDLRKIYYLICGKGPFRERLEVQVNDAGLGDNVKFLGFRTDMPDVLASADCFVFPSHREGLGIAAVEALLCGLPLIVADNRGTREYAIDTVNSIVCNADSAKDFAIAIKDLFNNERYREELASRSRASAMPFAVQTVEQTMEKVYKTWVNR